MKLKYVYTVEFRDGSSSQSRAYTEYNDFEKRLANDRDRLSWNSQEPTAVQRVVVEIVADVSEADQ